EMAELRQLLEQGELHRFSMPPWSLERIGSFILSKAQHVRTWSLRGHPAEKDEGFAKSLFTISASLTDPLLIKCDALCMVTDGHLHCARFAEKKMAKLMGDNFVAKVKAQRHGEGAPHSFSPG
ncbi:hypothetical protein PMAYCL1PPCAC_08883, partial [Pristionchus mayeri]